jgi:Holliday junction resolvase
LVGFEETQPIIDRYQAFTVALQIQYVRDKGPKQYIADAVRCIADTADPRLIRLIDLSEGRLVNSVPGKYLPYCDLYTLGVYDTIHRVFSEPISDDPYIAGMLELAARAETYRFKEEGNPGTSILDKAISAMRDVLILSEDYQKSILFLKKLALICAQHPACIFIASFVQRSHNFVLVQAYSDLDALAALNSAADNPWYADLIEEVFDGRGYLDALLRAVPSSPTLRLRQLMRLPYEQGGLALKELKLPEYRRLIYHGHLGVMHHKMDEAVSYYRLALASAERLPYVNAHESLYKALFAMGEIAQCIELVCDHYLENQHAFRLYPLDELLDEALKGECSQLGIGLPIIGFMTVHHVAPHRERDLSDIYEDYMDGLNLSRPSEIKPQVACRERMIFFLRHICTPRILDDSIVFEGVSDVERERIAICQMLIELDLENTEIYADEIRSITKEAEVARLLRSVEESKIYVDEEGILTVVQEHLRDAYARYKQLLDLPLLEYQTEVISKRLEELLAEKAHSETMNIRIPSSERETLFGNMYTTVVSNFAAHPAYGLDTYLSTGIRHGAFEGHLRSPMAVRDLLSERDAKRGEYRENQYWARRFADFPRSELSHIHRRLGRFSRTVDESISHFKKDLLQIRAVDTPEGLFSFRITREEQRALMAETSSSTTYDEFMDKLLRECWAATERSMAVVQRELRSTLQAQINVAFDSLMQSIEQVVSHDRVKELIDAIVSARTDFQAAMDHVCSWFHRATQISREPFYLDAALEVALKQIENCYRNQPFSALKTIDIEYLIKGQFLDGIVEIFFIMLQNVIRHSGFESGNPNVTIAAFENDNYLHIEVKNDLSPSVNIDERREVIAEAMRRYEHDSAMRMARQEGGSDLSKLWRILEFQLEVKHRISMAISSNRQFEVVLAFDATELRA